MTPVQHPHQTENRPISRSEWQSDDETSICNVCNITIKPTLLRSNKHHCRFCGKIVCNECSDTKYKSHRICTLCFLKKKLKKLSYSEQRESGLLSKCSPIPEYGEWLNLQHPPDPHKLSMINNIDRKIFLALTVDGKIHEFDKQNKDKYVAAAVIICMAICVMI